MRMQIKNSFLEVVDDAPRGRGLFRSQSADQLGARMTFCAFDFDEEFVKEKSNTRVEDGISQVDSPDQLPDDVLRDRASMCTLNCAKPEFDEDPLGIPEVVIHDPLDVAAGSSLQPPPPIHASGWKDQVAKDVPQEPVNHDPCMSSLEQTQGDNQDPHSRIERLLQQLHKKEEEPKVLDWDPQALSKEQPTPSDSYVPLRVADFSENQTHGMRPQDKIFQEAKRQYWCMLMMLKLQLDHPQFIPRQSCTD